ncbi:MAG: cytochrome c3 family protein [Longimicrobiales bacterium]|nr:cytochrome c3 family protein [Longimicrobiales bacterium]
MYGRFEGFRSVWAVALGLGLAGLAAGPEAAAAQRVEEPTSICVSCHAENEIEPMRARSHSARTTCLTCHHIDYSNDPSVVEARRLQACESCHGETPLTHASFDPACTECHTIHADPAVVGADLVGAGTCESCHGSGQHSLHAAVAGAPTCGECHTVHGAPEEVLAPSRMDDACASCHETESVHPSHAGIEGGLPCLECHDVDGRPATAGVETDVTGACGSCHEDVIPTHTLGGEGSVLGCADCHAFGEVLEPELAGPVMSQRCGGCHVEQLVEMESGGHAEGVAAVDPNTDLPNCMTCHTAHVDSGSRAAETRLAATIRCIECHSQGSLIEKYDLPENVAASYLDDYHGATVRFLWSHPKGGDQPNVMVCSDCHGAHAVGWDPETAMAPVCLECHDAGDEKLAGAWLGHDRAGPSNQILIWLIRLFYYVLIPFVLGGLFLNIVLHLGHERRHGARMTTAPKIERLRAWLAGKRPEKPRTVERFSVRERIEHMAAGTTFILLVVTGLPQTAPTSDFASAIIALFGGIESTRLIHRIVGFTFVALLVIHVTRGVMNIIRRRQLPAIMPTRRDFEALLQTVRHYLKGEPKPKVGKFDAAAKFEYWGLFFGGMIMSVTGVVLVFPEAVSQMVPGVVVGAMRVMHGLEATFAVLVVLLWHSWSVIFRPDIFPLDTSMFTGEIEVDRLKEEHALEYERLAAEGRLQPETD